MYEEKKEKKMDYCINYLDTINVESIEISENKLEKMTNLYNQDIKKLLVVLKNALDDYTKDFAEYSTKLNQYCKYFEQSKEDFDENFTELLKMHMKALKFDINNFKTIIEKCTFATKRLAKAIVDNDTKSS